MHRFSALYLQLCQHHAPGSISEPIQIFFLGGFLPQRAGGLNIVLSHLLGVEIVLRKEIKTDYVDNDKDANVKVGGIRHEVGILHPCALYKSTPSQE